MNVILNDRTKFIELGLVNFSIKTIKVEKIICKLLKKLVGNKELFQETFDLIKPIGSIRYIGLSYIGLT